MKKFAHERAGQMRASAAAGLAASKPARPATTAKVNLSSAAARKRRPAIETPTESKLVPVYDQHPLEIERGKGVYLYDKAGKEYIDFYGGHGVASLGHNPAPVLQALEDQSKRLMCCSNSARLAIREKAAEKLTIFADLPDWKVFFCNCGAEANENALKTAIKLTGRQKLVAFNGAFHGRTMLALSVTDNSLWHGLYSNWVGPVERIAPNDFHGLTLITNEVAAVILEPLQSIGKCTLFSAEFLRALREKCSQTGMLLLFDEVQTGMGRTGTPLMAGACGITPDLVTVANGLGGGMPVAAVLMKAEVAAQVKIGDLAATFGGMPLAMAAVIATIDCIGTTRLMARVGEMEQYLRKTLAMPQIKEIRGKGMLLGLVLEKESRAVRESLLSQGIIVGKNGDPRQLHLLPPLTIDKRHIDALKSGLQKVRW